MSLEDLRYKLIRLQDGSIVDIRSNFKGKLALVYKDGKWEVYRGDSGELFLGIPLTVEEIKDLLSKGIVSQ